MGSFKILLWGALTLYTSRSETAVISSEVSPWLTNEHCIDVMLPLQTNPHWGRLSHRYGKHQEKKHTACSCSEQGIIYSRPLPRSWSVWDWRSFKKKWGRIQPWSLLDTMLLSFFYKSSLSLPMSPIITFSGWQSSQRGPRRFKHNFTSAPGFSCWLDVVLVHEYNDHLIESLLAQSSYSNPHRPK